MEATVSNGGGGNCAMESGSLVDLCGSYHVK